MRRCIVLFLPLLLASCTSTPPRAAAPSQPLARGVAWLVARQTPAGAWRSENYLDFGDGPVSTATALWALTACPEGSVPRATVDRGVAYLRAKIGADGKVTSELPTYASALSVVVLARVAGPDDPDVKRIVKWLRGCQLAEPLGWAPSERAYGGWDCAGEGAQKPNLGQVDLSLVAFVVEALVAARVPTDDPVWERALMFVSRCQQADGGFLATPVPTLGVLNRAGEGKSYGTATCDGVRAMIACGGAADASGAWLDAQPASEVSSGLSAEWAEALRYDNAYVSVRARRVRGLAANVSWLGRLQREDGSWANPQPLMKEDDPLVATCLAVAALAEAEAGPLPPREQDDGVGQWPSRPSIASSRR